MDGNESFGEGIQKKSRWKSQGSKPDFYTYIAKIPCKA